MKTTIALILCACLAIETLQAQTNSVTLEATEAPASVEQEKGYGLVAFILAVVAGGAWIIWKVKRACPTCGDTVTLVLERSTNYVHWDPIYTNTVVLTNNDWVEMFREKIDQLREPNAYFRARLLK